MTQPNQPGVRRHSLQGHVATEVEHVPNTLLIGFGTTGFSSSLLLPPTNLDEYKTVIWQTSALVNEFPKAPIQQMPPPFADSMRFIETLKARVAELESWADAGHTLIVILDQPLSILEHGAQTNSHTRAVFDPGTLSIFSNAKLIRKAGTRVKVAAQNIEGLLGQWRDKIQYEYLVGRNERRDLLVVDTVHASGPQAVASVIVWGKGHIVFVPKMNQVSEWIPYLKDLSALHESFRPKHSSLPLWVDKFGSRAERDVRASITEKKLTIDTLQSAIDEEEARLKEFRWLKVLVAGTGDEFMHSVRRALECIGFQVSAVAGKRTDLIARDGNHLFACETKGVERAGKEEDLRQTRSWVTDVELALVADDDTLAADVHLEQCKNALAQLGVTRSEPEVNQLDVKGLLVLATFRDIPLDERTSADFPSDMALNASRTNVSTVSGHQLANLAIYCEHDPNERQRIRTKLFESAGALCIDDVPDMFARLAMTVR